MSGYSQSYASKKTFTKRNQIIWEMCKSIYYTIPLVLISLHHERTLLKLTYPGSSKFESDLSTLANHCQTVET